MRWEDLKPEHLINVQGVEDGPVGGGQSQGGEQAAPCRRDMMRPTLRTWQEAGDEGTAVRFSLRVNPYPNSPCGQGLRASYVSL